MSHDTNASNPPGPAPRVGKREIEKPVRLAERGEPKALEGLRSLINDHPTVGRVLTNRAGDMAALARDALVKYATGGGAALSAELMGRKTDQLRADLAGPNPTAERILAERVALCWFYVHASDRRFVANSERQPRRDGANKRFLDACRVLAASRKLGLPAIQFNVARQQVNVAGAAMGARGERE